MRNDVADMRFLREPPSTKELLEEKARLETEDSDLRWAAATPRGQRILKRILKASGLFESSLSMLRSDDVNRALTLAAIEGRKEVGYELFKDLMRLVPESSAWIFEQEEKAHE